MKGAPYTCDGVGGSRGQWDVMSLGALLSLVI